MGVNHWRSIAVAGALLLPFVTAKEFITVCYFPSWAYARESTLARYGMKDVDPILCSHLIYSFGKLDSQTGQLVATDRSIEEPSAGQVGKYREFNNLKKGNAGLRTLLSVGGQNDNGQGFQSVTESDEAVARFAKSTVGFLRERGFDGLDIDWEYPNSVTRNRLVSLLKGLRTAFNEEKVGGQKLILSLAGAAGVEHIDQGYDVPAISSYVDYVNLMTYDYTARTSTVTAFNSPLFSRPDTRFNPTLSMNYTVHYWLDRGLPAGKVVAGVTGVGRRLVLSNPNLTDVGSPVTGQVRVGEHYRLEGGLAYPEICLMLAKLATRRVFDSLQQVPYCVLGDEWVGYEDPQSVIMKIRWMLDQGLAGVMFWSIDQDDFSGKACSDGTYPLLKAIKGAIGALGPPQVTPGTPRSATPGQGAIAHSRNPSSLTKIIAAIVLVVFSI